MKIIFLDIDGVMNSTESMMDNYHNGVRMYNDAPDPKSIAALNKIIDSTDALIVITSTWRKLHNILSLGYIFHLSGLKGDPILGATPVIHNHIRGDEIQAWIDNYFTAHGPSIDSFVILDDDSDMGHLMDHLIYINGDTGLTMDDADKAIKMLNKGV